MDHLLEPLDTLRRKGVEFLRDHTVRLLCIGVDPPLRAGALAMLRGLEWHPDNEQAFFFLESPSTGATSWEVWQRELIGGYDELRAVRAPMILPAVDVGTEKSPGNQESAFCRTARTIQQRLGDLGVGGITLIVAPTEEHDPDLLPNALSKLIDDPEMGACRWIWLRQDGDVPPHTLQATCRWGSAVISVDESRQTSYLDSLLGEDERVFIEAWPDEPPPLHPSEPSSPDSATTNLRAPLLRAAVALQKGDGATALEHLERARDVAVTGGLVSHGLELDFALAVAQGSAARTKEEKVLARNALISTATRARTVSEWLIAAKVEIAFAALAEAAADFPSAVAAYRRAADDGKTADAPELAIKALLLAGEIALASARTYGQPTLEAAAARVWSEAVEIAKKLPTDRVRQTEAVACARRLIDTYRRAARLQDAEELSRWAHTTSTERRDLPATTC